MTHDAVVNRLRMDAAETVGARLPAPESLRRQRSVRIVSVLGMALRRSSPDACAGAWHAPCGTRTGVSAEIIQRTAGDAVVPSMLDIVLAREEARACTVRRWYQQAKRCSATVRRAATCRGCAQWTYGPTEATIA